MHVEDGWRVPLLLNGSQGLAPIARKPSMSCRLTRRPAVLWLAGEA